MLYLRKHIFLSLFIFFIFVSSTFACSAFVIGWPTDWSISHQSFPTAAAADAYCRSSLLFGGSCSKFGPEPCLSNPDYDFICWKNDLGTHSQYFALYCGSSFDSDGDGIPDSEDPCPDNPNPNCTDPDDGDGDGIPDDQDPCPDNPNPNCTDPNEPPEIPGEIIIADCTVDITDLQAWLLSDGSFPFNFMWRIYSIFSPLFSAVPEAPVIETAIPLDPSSQYDWVPDSFPITIDFSFLDPIALVVRQLEMAGMTFLFALYGFRRYRSFAGV